jgi:hypothetical protein
MIKYKEDAKDSKISRVELIRICKEKHIKGFSRLKKDEIIRLICYTEKDHINTKLSLKRLKELAKNKGIKNYSKYTSKNKDELVNLLNQSQETNYTENNKIITEDLGKIFEMSICLLYNIEYDGKYKYNLEEAHKIKTRIFKLKELFPYNITHCAKNGNKYDFMDVENKGIYLSAKTTKKDGKVCPQVIGQPSRKKFCSFFKIELLNDLLEIKSYITINIKTLLEQYIINTFDCPVIYYNQHKNLLFFIKLKKNIEWLKYDISFSHIIKNKEWNESTCISIDNITIGEFQIHNNRDCIKFRWVFEKLLNFFNDNFEIITIL